MGEKSEKYGVIAILDALGASNFDKDKTKEFMNAKNVVIKLLKDVSSRFAKLYDVNKVTIMTFNDTILLSLITESEEPKPEELFAFFSLMSKFVVDSFSKKMLFRGAVSLGSFYLDKRQHIIMGEAVADAAAWYDKADWIGIAATPHTSIFLQSGVAAVESWNECSMHYEVPLNNGNRIKLEALNWPMVLQRKELTPCTNFKISPRRWLLKHLSLHRIPMGTESKYFNTIDFFDCCCDRNRALKGYRANGLFLELIK